MYRDIAKRRAAGLRWYYRNKEKKNATALRIRRELAQWLIDLKSKLSCIRCGESHPACIGFHHRDPSTKDDAVSNLVRQSASRERILEEIAKCDVLCPNCHLKEHGELRVEAKRSR